MSARYWVLCADEVMNSVEQQWPDGLRPIELNPVSPPDAPEAHWWLLEDDGAPASLEGKQVELTFVRSGGGIMIGSRSPHV